MPRWQAFEQALLASASTECERRAISGGRSREAAWAACPRQRSRTALRQALAVHEAVRLKADTTYCCEFYVVSGCRCSVDRARTGAARVAARAACTNRLRCSSIRTGGVSGKHRETALQLMAVTRRTLGRLAAAHERFKLVVALFARVFEQRHESIVRDRRQQANCSSRPSA